MIIFWATILLLYVLYKSLSITGVYKIDRNIVARTLTVNGSVFTVNATYRRRLHISRKRRHKYSIKIENEKVLPNIFLDAHYKDRFGYATEYKSYDQEQRISLEGDFDQYFQLYAPKALGSEPLSLITPDIMIMLRDRLLITDMTMVDHELLLKTNTSFTETVTEDLLVLLQKVARFNKFTKPEEEWAYTHKKLAYSADEAVKFGARLVPVGPFVLFAIFILPSILSVLFLYVADGYKFTNVEWRNLFAVTIPIIILTYLYFRRKTGR